MRFCLMSTNHSAASRATQTGPSPRVAPTLSTLSGTGAMASAPARVDEIIMPGAHARIVRSEEHTSELQSLMRISYAVFCLKKKTQIDNKRLERTIANSITLCDIQENKLHI